MIPVILNTTLPIGTGPVKRGKVRDIYDLGEQLLIVTTDRISAFDRILPNGIPGKGQVLTQLALFWFQWLEKEGIDIQHHIITGDVNAFPASLHPYRETLAGRSMLVKKVTPLPIEAVVRGYLAGSGWKEYSQTRTVCGIALPEKLIEASRLPEPIFTPSTKGEIGEHDLPISFDQMRERVGEYAEHIREISLLIYQKAAAFAETQGIIIADTKMEFGVDAKTGQLLLIDELLTPDSSRFWPKDRYQPGQSPVSFDKQYIRDYLLSIHFSGDGPTPSLPDEVIENTRQKYLEAQHRLMQSGMIL